MSHYVIKCTAKLIMAALALGHTACVPVIANLSKGDAVPMAVTDRVPKDAEILVLPLWLDTGDYNFHDPYVIPATAIGTSQAKVPRRMGFYFDFFVCGGPSTFVVGYLIILESGGAIWSDERGENATTDTDAVTREIRLFVSGGEFGPTLADLLQFGTIKVGLDASKEQRESVLRFIDRISRKG